MTNYDLIIKSLPSVLAEMCENSKRCYFCPFYNIECPGVFTNALGWSEWLQKEVRNAK